MRPLIVGGGTRVCMRVLAVVVAMGCTSQPATSSTTTPAPASVVSPSLGTPVTVTDMATLSVLPGYSIDAAGLLSSALPPGHYAIAVTTPERFAFIERT